MRRRFRALVFVWLAFVACGDGESNSTPSIRIELEEGSRSAATIGSAGGSIEATSSAGDHFTLNIPEGALLEDTDITLTPLASVSGASGGEDLFGVHFEPEGLWFLRGATLEMTPARGVEGLPKLRAFAYEGDGENYHLIPARVEGSTIRLSVSHFSGVGGGYDLPPQDPADYDDPMTRMLVEVEAILNEHWPDLPANDPSFQKEVAVPFDRYYRDVLLPGAEAAKTDPDSLQTIVRLAVQHDATRTALATDDEASRLGDRSDPLWSCIFEAFDNAIEHFNQRCRETGDIELFARAVEMTQMATALDETDTPRLESLFQNACIEIDVDLTSSPAELAVGESGQVSVLVGWRAGQGPVQYDEPILVSASANQHGSVTPEGPEQADPQFKSFETTVTALSATGAKDELVVEIEACAFGGNLCKTLEVEVDVLSSGCNFDVIGGQGEDRFVGVFSGTAQTAAGPVPFTDYPLELRLTQGASSAALEGQAFTDAIRRTSGSGSATINITGTVDEIIGGEASVQLTLSIPVDDFNLQPCFETALGQSGTGMCAELTNHTITLDGTLRVCPPGGGTSAKIVGGTSWGGSFDVQSGSR